MPVTPRVPERLHWAAELLDVRPTDHVLEIGCGAGHLVALLAERAARGSVTAIDRSATAVERARGRNAEAIATGRVRIEQQALGEADLGRRFPKVVAVNVNAFWAAPAPSIAALGALMRPAGGAFLVYEPPTEARLREMREWLPVRLEEHGLTVDRVLARPFARGHGLCVVGRW